MMVEVIGEMYGFNWIYDPPADGEWGAFQESGKMSGLIGQAGCKIGILNVMLSIHYQPTVQWIGSCLV